MADQGTIQAAGSGPGNKVIAMTLLESLAVRGLAAEHTRAIRALGLADSELANAPAWLADDALAEMLVAGEVEPSLARSIGHRLVSPDVIGIALYGLGLATPEKAYRRVQALLPRERASAVWTVDEIASGSARLCFHDQPPEGSAASKNRKNASIDRGRNSFCALRAGMLEAIPCLYGLLPARVVETTCRSRGADACRYEIVWQRSLRTGLIAGGAVGLGFGLASLGMSLFLGPAMLPVSAGVIVVVSPLMLGATIGRCLDLHRQIAAVAGARRGHLALFDQVDDALASKLDALARADAKLEGDESVYRPDRSRPASENGSLEGVHDRSALLLAAEKIHGVAGDLECWLDEAGRSEGSSNADDVGAPRARLREIRDSAEELVEGLSSGGERSRKAVDITNLLARAIATARPSLPAATVIEFEHDEDVDSVECEPVQIEQVVVQLLRNAASSSHGLSESPLIKVTLARVARGIEFAIEDRGVGIDPAEIDEVFDPFFGERLAGVDEGFGLPICLRIVERHGGELRIEVEDRPGTRVSIFLPQSAQAGA